MATWQGLRIVVAVALVATVGAARASAAGARAEDYPVEIRLEGAADSVELRGPGGPVDCDARCSVNLRVGRYRDMVKDADGHKFVQVLDVSRPMRVTLAPGSQGARIAGGVMYGGGLVSLFAGSGMVASYVVEGICREKDCGDPHREQLLIAGAITLSAGVALLVTGRIVWRRRGYAHISDTPAAPPPSTAVRLRLAPAAGFRWTGLALTGSF